MNKQKFLDSLDKATYYKVDNPKYSHALPEQMTDDDINKLMETYQAGADINEGSMKYSGQLLL